MDMFSERDQKFVLALMFLGAVIGYVSTFFVGLVLLLIVGAIIAVVIGAKSQSLKHALLLGAFFGIIIITANSQLVRGYSPNWNDDIFTSVFVPYFRDALIAAVLGGIISAVGFALVAKKSKRIS